MRIRSFFHRARIATVAVSSFAAVLAAPQAARAQQAVSDADRLAARELFTSGVQLQQSGKWADALDRFQRAQAVFSAPTNLLHVAECQAQLGRLVEAAETYRGLTRLSLPKDSPQTFIAAQQQGAAELQQVEARIPKVRIDVTPTNVSNLSVTIDDQPMNVALVGVDRPIDPGPHKIVAFAPGYGQKEATVTIKEKDPPKQVSLLLQPTGGVTYTAAVAGAGGTEILASGPGSAPPPPNAPDQPAPYVREQPSDKLKPPSFGFLLGLRLGADVLAGSLVGGSASGSANDVALSDVAGTGGVFGLQGGIRFARKGYVGLIYEHAFLGQGSQTGSLGAGTANATVTTYDNLYAIDLGYISNPEGFGVVLDAGLGIRDLGVSVTNSAVNWSASFTGGELLLGGGLWIKAGNAIRIVPRIDVGLGSFTNQSYSNLFPNAGTTVTNSQGHAIIFLGVGGYFNIDVAKKS